jgi:hypothetical protein
MINASRLRFVVANFRQMQGLRQVALGLCILGVCAPLFLETSLGLRLTGILIVPGLIGLFFALDAVNTYYERRVGYIETKPPGAMRSILTIFLTSVGPFLIHPGSLGSFGAYMQGFSSAWWVGCIYLGIVVRTRRRWYYLPFGAFFLLLGVWRSGTANLEVWAKIDKLLLGMLPVAMIITGLLDHFYLLRTFPGSGEARDA